MGCGDLYGCIGSSNFIYIYFRLNRVLEGVLLNRLQNNTTMHKKGQLNLLKSGLLGIVVVGIIGIVGAYIMSQFGSQFTAGTAPAHVAGNATETLVTVMSWLPIVGITLIGSVVLGLILLYIAR